MCGRYTLVDPDRLRRAFEERFTFEEFSEYRLPRFNIAPTQSVLGVRNDGRDLVEGFVWGIHGRMNARAETLASRPERRRCIVFADGFYEWRSKRPMYFTLHPPAPFAFAGVWAAQNGTTECAIITCEPNEIVEPIHNRMPVILQANALDLWLSEDALPGEVVRSLLVPFPAGAMSVRPASSRLNDVRYDAPDVLADDEPLQQGFAF